MESIETFVSKENFKKHIRPDVYNIEEIEGSLELRRKDLAKTDCSVIVVGTFLNNGNNGHDFSQNFFFSMLMLTILQ